MMFNHIGKKADGKLIAHEIYSDAHREWPTVLGVVVLIVGIAVCAFIWAHPAG